MIAKYNEEIITEIEFPDLEALSDGYQSFKDILDKRAEYGNFTYTIDIDYDTLTIIINFKILSDDNPERNPQLN